MQICMGRFSATTPALYNTNRGRGNTRKEDERSSRSLRSCVGKGPSLEIYWATVLSLSRISSTSVHLNYLRDCTVSEVIEWTDVDGWSVGWSVGRSVDETAIMLRKVKKDYPFSPDTHLAPD